MQSAKVTKRRRVTQKQSRSRTLTRKKILPDGTVETTEERVEHSIEDCVTMEAQREMRLMMDDTQRQILERPPRQAVLNNPVLRQRLDRVMADCKSFRSWGAVQNHVQTIVADQKSRGTGYVALFPWTKVMEYAQHLEKLEKADGEKGGDHFIAGVFLKAFVDKLLVSAVGGKKGEWPVCTSPMGEIQPLQWGDESLQMVRDMRFAFTDGPLQGYSFGGSVPMDVMLLEPSMKEVFRESLIESKNGVLETLDVNPGFQNYVHCKLKK